MEYIPIPEINSDSDTEAIADQVRRSPSTLPLSHPTHSLPPEDLGAATQLEQYWSDDQYRKQDLDAAT